MYGPGESPQPMPSPDGHPGQPGQPGYGTGQPQAPGGQQPPGYGGGHPQEPGGQPQAPQQPQQPRPHQAPSGYGTGQAPEQPQPGYGGGHPQEPGGQPQAPQQPQQPRPGYGAGQAPQQSQPQAPLGHGAGETPQQPQQAQPGYGVGQQPQHPQAPQQPHPGYGAGHGPPQPQPGYGAGQQPQPGYGAGQGQWPGGYGAGQQQGGAVAVAPGQQAYQQAPHTPQASARPSAGDRVLLIAVVAVLVVTGGVNAVSGPLGYLTDVNVGVLVLGGNELFLSVAQTVLGLAWLAAGVIVLLGRRFGWGLALVSAGVFATYESYFIVRGAVIHYVGLFLAVAVFALLHQHALRKHCKIGPPAR